MLFDLGIPCFFNVAFIILVLTIHWHVDQWRKKRERGQK